MSEVRELVNEALVLVKDEAAEADLFQGWFTIEQVWRKAVDLELEEPLRRTLERYGWQGEVICEATRLGLAHAVREALKEPLPEFLPDVRLRSHMTQRVGNTFYWYPTPSCDHRWFDELGQNHTEIIRVNLLHRQQCYALRDLLRRMNCELGDVPRNLVKEILREGGGNGA